MIRHFTREDTGWQEKLFNINCYFKKNANENGINYCVPIQTANIKNNTNCQQGCGVPGNSHPLLVRMQNGIATSRKTVQFII